MSTDDIISSLPEEPIAREALDSLLEHESVVDFAPLYAGMVNPAALGNRKVVGIALETEEYVVGLGFDVDDSWKIISKVELETSQTEKDVLNSVFHELRQFFEEQMEE